LPAAAAAPDPYDTISVIPEIPRSATVEFITDVEGNYEYFRSVLSRSRVLTPTPSGSFDLSPNGYLIHGGDAVDKGPGDIRVVKALISLKKRYPERVFLILGNRDFNKLRFPAELEPSTLQTSTDVYWDDKHKPYTTWCEENLRQPSLVPSKLRWMLECTMGCPDTFELRRSEVAHTRLVDSALITDDDVLKSFADSVDPQGSDPWMLEYVRLGNVMLVFGDAIFCHGGLSAQALGYVPGPSSSAAGAPPAPPEEVDAGEWCAGLNAWKDACVRGYCEDPKSSSHHSLLDYGVPNGSAGKTVVYTNHLKGGNCAAPDVEVEEFCEVNGVRRLFVGHAPHGECPSVIKRPSVTIFSCDTSRSDPEGGGATGPKDFRGKAVTMVTVKRDVTRVEGVLKDGSEVNKYVVAVDDSRNNLPDSLVGRQLVDDSWVKGVVEGKGVMVAKGEGYKIAVEYKDVKDVLEKLKPMRGVGGSVLARRDQKEAEKRERERERRREKKEEEKRRAKQEGSFLDRQAAHQRSTADKISKAKAEKETQRSAVVGSFKAKPLPKGAMASRAAKVKADEEERRRVREAKNKAEALEKSLLAAAPVGGGAGRHETQAQRRARERGEEEKEKARG